MIQNTVYMYYQKSKNKKTIQKINSYLFKGIMTYIDNKKGDR